MLTQKKANKYTFLGLQRKSVHNLTSTLYTDAHRQFSNCVSRTKLIYVLQQCLTNAHGFVVDMMKQELQGGIGLGPSSSPSSSSSSFFSSLFFWSVLAFLFTERKKKQDSRKDKETSALPEQDSKHTKNVRQHCFLRIELNQPGFLPALACEPMFQKWELHQFHMPESI